MIHEIHHNFKLLLSKVSVKSRFYISGIKLSNFVETPLNVCLR